MKPTLIERTGQLWKWRLGRALSLSGVAVLVAMDLAAETGARAMWSESRAFAVSGSLALIVGGAVYVWTAIRCPGCSARWTAPGARPTRSLTRRCPQCRREFPGR